MAKLLRIVAALLKATIRIKVVHAPGFNDKQAALLAFWHGKQLLPCLCPDAFPKTPKAALTSSSQDGEILGRWLSSLGYKVLRGSSSRNNLQALRSMLRVLQQGYTLGFGIDGPRGPIYKVKPGMTHMAAKLNIPILCVGSAFSSYWLLKNTWDQFILPKPFATAILYVAPAIYINKEQNLEQANLQLEQQIALAETRAQSLLDSLIDD